MDKVWLRAPFGVGEPKEVEATPEVLTPMMVLGWYQCEPPESKPAHPQEVASDVRR